LEAGGPREPRCCRGSGILQPTPILSVRAYRSADGPRVRAARKAGTSA
jgi:hypothetical protein